jgi:hypothetical protein
MCPPAMAPLRAGLFRVRPVSDKQPNRSGCWYDIARGREGGLREAGLLELLTIQPARIMIGATVFMMGILSGAGIAMWVMPPV